MIIIQYYNVDILLKDPKEIMFSSFWSNFFFVKYDNNILLAYLLREGNVLLKVFYFLLSSYCIVNCVNNSNPPTIALIESHLNLL